ncbi:MAG: hypothetical protein ACXWAT_00100 [Methylobacter sp.]
MAGLLDYLSNVKFAPNAAGMGLLNMGAQILANSGPSALPQSPFQSLGHGINGFAQGFDQQKAIEAAHAAAQQKALLDASAIKENEAKAGYYASGGAGSDGYHQPIQTAQGWAQWSPQTKNYEIIQLNNKPALPVTADVNLAGNMAAAKEGEQVVKMIAPDGSEVMVQAKHLPGYQVRNERPQQSGNASFELSADASPEDRSAIEALRNKISPQAPITTGQGQSTMAKKQAEANVENQQKIDQAGDVKRSDAREALNLLNQAEPLLSSSTGSGVGALYDDAAGFFGKSTPGAESSQSLKVLGAALISKMPKMSGPQSDKDVLLYKQMAAEIGDPWIPKERKIAAVATLRKLQEYYAGDHRQDVHEAPAKDAKQVKFLGFE